MDLTLLVAIDPALLDEELDQSFEGRRRGGVTGLDGMRDIFGFHRDEILALIGNTRERGIFGEIEEVGLFQYLTQGGQVFGREIGRGEIKDNLASHDPARLFKVDAHTASANAELQAEDIQDGIQTAAASRAANGDAHFGPAFLHGKLFETANAK